MSSLMQLTDEYKQLIEWAEDPETDPQTLNDTMESVTAEIRGKVDACNVVMARLESRRDLLKRMAKGLTDDAKKVDAHIDSFKQYIMNSMNSIGERKLQGDVYKMFIKANGGNQTMEVDDDAVPDNYKKTVTQTMIDKDKIKADLEAGKELTFARLLPRGEHLEGDWTKIRKVEEKEGK